MMEVFTARKNDLINRFDPIYIRFSLSFKINSNFNLIELGSLLSVPPQYGANERAIDGNSQSDYRYIRITDIDEFGNLKLNEFKTAENIEDRYILKTDDILFARSGATAGKCFIFTDDMPKSIFAGYLIRFSFDQTKILPKYVFYICQLEYYKKWVNSIQRPAGQPNINSEEFKSFEIPLPDISTQQQIIQIMDEAYFRKSKNEDEADRLIDGIDDLIKNILSVHFPDEQSHLSFQLTNEVIEGRLDPFYYQPKFLYRYEAIKKTKYDILSLDDITKNICNGKEFRKYSETGFRYLRVTDMGRFGINNSSPRFIQIKEIPPQIKLSYNDLLISRSGSLGLVNTVTEEILNSVLSSHIFKVSLNTEIVIPNYIEAFLRSSIGQFQFFHKNNGGIVPEINQSALKSILIIVPPLSIQKDICNEVENRIQKADKLNFEAIDGIEQAKREVEKLLFEQEE